MKIHIANPSERPEGTYRRNRRFLFSFGAYGSTHVLVYGRSLDDALDEAIDWLVDNAPGHLMDEQVAEAYREAIAAGKSEEEAAEEAETDMTCGGNCGHYIASWEWFVSEVTREDLLSNQPEFVI
jgi:hypothetical protein